MRLPSIGTDTSIKSHTWVFMLQNYNPEARDNFVNNTWMLIVPGSSEFRTDELLWEFNTNSYEVVNWDILKQYGTLIDQQIKSKERYYLVELRIHDNVPILVFLFSNRKIDMNLLLIAFIETLFQLNVFFYCVTGLSI